MKRLFYFIIVLSYTLWNCGGDDKGVDGPNNPDNPDTPTNVTLDISTTDLTFEAKGGQKEFTIYCNSDWTITNNSTWCKIDVTNGNGNKTITVTADPYSETEDQNTNLTIKAGDKTKVLTITQKHGDAIILTKDKFDVPQEGDNITIEVKSNIEYQVSIPSQFQSWIKEAVKSKAVTTKNFSFTISANEDFDKREGYIVFSGNSLKDTVYVYQAQKNQLILTEDTYNIPAEGKDIIVELKTNVDYEVAIPNDAKSWISQVTTKAIRTDQLKFHIEANNENNNRSAKVVIKDKNSDLSDTICITQIQNGTYVGNVILTTIEEVKAFQKAGYKRVTGNLSIQEYHIKTLVNLNNQLEEINGDLILNGSSLSNLDGLYALKTIGGNLKYYSSDLESFQGLNNLKTIGGDLEISSDLKSLEGLENLSSIGGDLKDVYPTQIIRRFPLFQGLNNLKTIDGSLWINSNQTSLEGLESLSSIGGDLNIISSSHLKSLKGLNGLKTVGGSFVFSPSSFSSSTSQESFESFEGLENLSSIGGDLKIISKPTSSGHGSGLKALKSFKGLNGLKTIEGDFEISSPFSSTSFLESFESFEGLENLSSIGGDLKIISTSSASFEVLKSFQGLNGLKTIGGSLMISFSSSESTPSSLKLFESFEGLENLSSIGGDLKIISNSYGSALKAFKSLKGLNGLKTIGGSFEISSTAYSSSFESFESFEGLENLSSIGGDLKIISNSTSSTFASALKALKSFKGLNNLKTIGGSFISSNQFLMSENLENLVFVGKNINLYSNAKLIQLQKAGGSCSFSTNGTLDLSNLEIIGGPLTIQGCNDIGSLSKLKTVGDITIVWCSKLYDFCVLKPLLSNYKGTFLVKNCGYNPTKYQILNGECSKQPE